MIKPDYYGVLKDCSFGKLALDRFRNKFAMEDDGGGSF